MSEYQYVAFRAIDAPLSDEALEFMEEQSSRAEITRWSFDNEYHFGDFRGDEMEMLRRGYDIHLHYANFGCRKLFIRLPNGFPNAKAAAGYLDEESLTFVKDKKGPGGILCIEPFIESGELEELWDLDEWLDQMVPIRAEILNGDLRPLYIAHLAVSCDGNHDWDETLEAPVPAGLKKPTEAQVVLAEFYGIGSALLSAAAKNSEPLPPGIDASKQYEAWLKKQSEADKTAWLLELLQDPHSTARGKMLAKFQKEHDAPAWPTAKASRTMSELMDMATGIQKDQDRKAQAKAEREHKKRLEKMAADPQPFLKEAEKLVEQRSTDSFRKAAELLVELREALAGTEKANLPEEHAQKLREKLPKNSRVVGVFRKEGLLPKK